MIPGLSVARSDSNEWAITSRRFGLIAGAVPAEKRGANHSPGSGGKNVNTPIILGSNSIKSSAAFADGFSEALGGSRTRLAFVFDCHCS
jgi:hypothetical protein